MHSGFLLDDGGLTLGLCSRESEQAAVGILTWVQPINSVFHFWQIRAQTSKMIMQIAIIKLILASFNHD